MLRIIISRTARDDVQGRRLHQDPSLRPNKKFFEIHLQTLFMPECRKKGFLSQHAQLALIRANIKIPCWINRFYCPLQPAFQTGQNATVFTS